MNNDRRLMLLFAMLLLLFAGGIVTLFLIRFSAGDVYPVYSSLRSDPLGAKVFYEAAGRLPGVTAGRNYRHISKLDNGQNTTICFFGVSPASLRYVSRNEIDGLERMAREGGRIVMLMYPDNSIRRKAEKKADNDALPDQRKGPEETVQKERDTGKGAEPQKTGMVSLMEKWGFSLDRDEAQEQGSQGRTQRATLADNVRLPGELAWHSATRASDTAGVWKTLYAVNERPVLIERALGKGTIVVATDTYLVSNEAMLKARHPDLLVWLIGTNGFILFDETHFGLREDPGVAALARKYHLEWFFGGLLLAAALFIWKNSMPLRPVPDDIVRDRGADLLAGKGMRAGFVNLLRRNISEADLVPLCYETWEKTSRSSSRDLSEKMRDARVFVTEEKKRDERGKDAVSAYNRVKNILSERKST